MGRPGWSAEMTGQRKQAYRFRLAWASVQGQIWSGFPRQTGFGAGAMSGAPPRTRLTRRSMVSAVVVTGRVMAWTRRGDVISLGIAANEARRVAGEVAAGRVFAGPRWVIRAARFWLVRASRFPGAATKGSLSRRLVRACFRLARRR